MAGSIVRRHLNKNFELVGVFASAAAYLAFLNKQSAEKGMTYYDTTLNQLRTHDGSSFSPAGQNGVSAGSLDDAANIGTKITIDGAMTSGVEIEATDAKISSDGALLLLDNNDTGSDVHALEITSTSTAAAIKLNNNSATTDDIQGTGDVWAITGQGLATFDKGVEILGDTASATLKLGAGSDITISYTDGGTPGVVGAGLMFKANTSADQIQIGDSTRAIDVWFEGSADTNYMLWDASANLLILNGSDIRLEDSDVLGFGDADDVTMTWNGSNLLIEAATDDTGSIIIGSTNSLDLSIRGSTNSNIALFDVSTAILEMNGWDIHLQDDDILQFGDASGGDVSIRWDGTDLDILAAADDTVIKFGTGTNSFDIWIYGETANDNIIFDASANKLSLDGIDLKLEDDDYILLGDSATAGSSADGTLRWDSSNSVLEIIGNTTFEGATIIVDNDLTVSGTLTLSGALSPSSLALGDGEALTFGAGDDLTMSATGTTMTMAILSGSLLEITGSGGNEMTIGATANLVNQTLFGTFDIGEDGKGYDAKFFAETTGDFILWDQDGHSNLGALIFEDSAIQFAGASATYTLAISTSALLMTATDNSAAKVTWGDNGTNGLDQEWLSVSSGNLLNWDAGAETLKFTDILCTMTGADNRGTILAIVGNDASGNTDTVTINAEGTGSALKITADDVDSIQQSIICKTAQTSSMLVIDGTTTNGWTGAAGVGMVNITNDSTAVNSDGTMVNILKTGNLAAANDGICLEIEETGAAQATTYAVRISSTSNEALHIDAGEVVVDEFLTANPAGATGGLVTKFGGGTDLTGTPTAAEFDTEFGTTAKGKPGFVGVAEDTGDGKNYLVCSDGTTWHFVAMTAAS